MDLTPTGPSARRLRASARRARQALAAHLPPVLVFTDPNRSADPLDLARLIPSGWGLVYRHFGGRDRSEIASELAKWSRIRRFSLLIGADPNLAKAVGACGVHWPEAEARLALKWAGGFRLNTMSAHSVRTVQGPQPPGIQARVLSTVFPSNSPSAGSAMGALRFRKLALVSETPLYALGGVNAETAPKIASVSGLAGVGQIGP